MMDTQPESMTGCQVSQFYTADGVSSRDPTNPVIPDPGPSSSQYHSAEDDVLSIDSSRSKLISEELEREIEVSKVHWSELSSQYDSDADDGESNRQIFERLRLSPQYQYSWLKCRGFLDPSDIVVGQKLAEGGQAEIYEVEIPGEDSS